MHLPLLPVKRAILSLILTCSFFFYAASVYAAVPPNDSCGGVIPNIIGNSSFGIGTFTSTQDDMTASNMQPGESFSLIASMVKQRITVPKNIFKSINAYYAIN
jgi:hypothetical protein